MGYWYGIGRCKGSCRGKDRDIGGGKNRDRSRGRGRNRDSVEVGIEILVMVGVKERLRLSKVTGGGARDGMRRGRGGLDGLGLGQGPDGETWGGGGME